MGYDIRLPVPLIVSKLNDKAQSIEPMMVYSIHFINKIIYSFLICCFEKVDGFDLLDAILDVSYNLVSQTFSYLPFLGLQSLSSFNKPSTEELSSIQHYNACATGEQERLLSTEQSSCATSLRSYGKNNKSGSPGMNHISELRARGRKY